MPEKTQFEMKISARESRDDEKVNALNASSNERNFILSFDYHMTRDKVMMEIIRS